jgi:hypothetical protein
VRALQQRLSDAGDVAVAEDAEAAGEEPLLVSVALDVLGDEEADGRLRDREADVAHGVLLGRPNGSRGSVGESAQVSRTQACAGSSQMRQARSSPVRP